MILLALILNRTKIFYGPLLIGMNRPPSSAMIETDNAVYYSTPSTRVKPSNVLFCVIDIDTHYTASNEIVYKLENRFIGLTKQYIS